MYTHLFANPYVIDKKKLQERLDDLIEHLNTPGIKGEFTIVEELLRLILKFYTGVKVPSFNTSFLVDKRECPSSTKMNETWKTCGSDLNNLFDQQNSIDESIVVGYNYFLAKKENVLSKVKNCGEMLTKTAAICRSKNSPFFEIVENFDTDSGVDYEFVPGGERITYDPYIGAITLGSNSETIIGNEEINKITMKAYWNGAEISEKELLESPDVSDGKMYGVYGDHGENGIRIGLTNIVRYSEYSDVISPTETPSQDSYVPTSQTYPWGVRIGDTKYDWLGNVIRD